MANGSLVWFPPNRPATTFPEFHNLKGIPQETSYLPMVEFGTALSWTVKRSPTPQDPATWFQEEFDKLIARAGLTEDEGAISLREATKRLLRNTRHLNIQAHVDVDSLLQALFEMNPTGDDVLGQLANAVSGFQRQVAIACGSNSKLQAALAETQADLALTQTKLRVTETRLAGAVAELEETRVDLRHATRRIERLETDHDKLQLGQVAFTYESLVVRRVALPRQIRTPKTVKELDALLQEDWSDRAESEVEKATLRTQQTTACESWKTVRSQYFTDHKIRDAIRLLKHLRLGTAHPFVDLSNDTIFRKVKGAIQEHFDEGERDDLVHLAKQVRQLQLEPVDA